jgi:hypothetical protein
MSQESGRNDSEPPIEQWLEQLHRPRGAQQGSDTDDLAAVLKRQQTADEAAVARAGLDGEAAEQQALQQLRFRLRREGVDFKAAPTRQWWAAGAVAMLAVAVTVNLFRPDPADPWMTYDYEPPTLRGTGPIEQTAREPAADARALAAKLHAAGIAPLVYVHGDRVTVSFALQAEQVQSVEQAVLAPLGLKGARQGENQITFVRTRP